jgi:hypothetical protein
VSSYLTREYADSIDSLKGLTPEQRRTIVEHGDAVYEEIRRAERRGMPLPEEDALRKWGESNEIGPTAMTAALQYLRESGQILAVARTAAPIEESTEPRAHALADMTDTQIRELASELEIEGRSKMSVRQLKNRIEKIEAGEDDR